LHPVKGLPRLVQAWATIENDKAESVPLKSRNWESKKLKSEDPGQGKGDWVLVLAGPDEGGHRCELESIVTGLGCQSSVMFADELNDKQKWGALAAADLFVMPSDFENFGVAIVEAMFAGLPVLTTTGTPWSELPLQSAGWWIAPSPVALARALREAVEMPDQQRRAMGQRAMALARQFQPEQTVASLIEVYRWLLARGPRPECVRLE
jgi:glycosyltransferase involved in cell wall biosynthesis